MPSPTWISAVPESEIEYCRLGAQCQPSTYPGGETRKVIPVADCVAGRLERDGLTVDEDLARVRAVQPGQDAHERRFAGAIFAQ